MRFEFATANRIIFGPGTCAEVPALAAPFGRRAFVVTDSKERCAFLLEGLLARGLSTFVFLVEKEPDLDSIILATRIFKENGCDFVIGFGGGATLDTGKAVAALTANPGNPTDYLEVVGSGHALEKPSAPYIAIPTTAGTGSEVTRNAVIAIPEKRIKVSLRSPYMLPRLAIVDPELTYSLPAEITASTGMDALTQCIEPFICNAPNPITDAFCRDGIRRATRSLRKAYQNGKDTAAREDMALASLYGGMALANAKLGAVHGFAAVIGAMFPAPHGAVCARLLTSVMKANLRALRKRDRNSPALDRYAEVAMFLTGNALARTDDGIRWVHQLSKSLNICPLSAYGVHKEDFPAIVAQAKLASSMKGNPILLTEHELTEILEEAI